MNHIGPGFDETAAARLFFHDGLTRDEPPPPFTRLRLVYETPTIAGDRPPLASVKVLEAVQGARVVVTAAPGTDLQLGATVRTIAGRDVIWASGTRVGPEGIVDFRVPYATGPNGSGTATLAVSDGTRRAATPGERRRRRPGPDRPRGLAAMTGSRSRAAWRAMPRCDGLQRSRCRPRSATSAAATIAAIPAPPPVLHPPLLAGLALGHVSVAAPFG